MFLIVNKILKKKLPREFNAEATEIFQNLTLIKRN